MRYTASLDPGSRRAGWAVLDSGLLVAAGSVVLPRANVAAMVAALVEALRGAVDPASAAFVVEYPRKYATHRAAWADIDDLRTVAAHVEAIGWATRKRVAPGTWKGNVPKAIHHNRISAGLGPTEIAIWVGLGPDGRDAVGLARWAFGSAGP